jgi:uncharacterized membrane protein YcfT
MEPTTSTSALAITASAAGLTVFGVTTGLHPNLLLAGLFGGLIAMSYHPPSGILARILFMVGSALIAGYVAPAAAAIIAASAASLLSWWPRDITHQVIQFPVAFLIGFLGLRWLMPAIDRRARKLEGEH